MKGPEKDKFGRLVDHDYDGCRRIDCEYLIPASVKAPDHCLHRMAYPGSWTRTKQIVAIYRCSVCPKDREGKLVRDIPKEKMEAYRYALLEKLKEKKGKRDVEQEGEPAEVCGVEKG